MKESLRDKMIAEMADELTNHLGWVGPKVRAYIAGLMLDRIIPYLPAHLNLRREYEEPNWLESFAKENVITP